jgi:hypothetical protein
MKKDKGNPLILIAVISLALFVVNEAWKIYDQGGGEFADSASLQKLRAVDSDLVYKDGRMSHVHGLSNLGFVGGTLDLSNNDLPNIDGLRSLSLVEGALVLSGNQFHSTAPLNGLGQVGGSLDLRDNPNLFNLDGLKNLMDLGGNLYLDDDVHLRQDFLGIPSGSYLCSEIARTKIRGPEQSEICR